jgi:anaerobic selenocysteine-containing dehydrogenase
VRAAFRRLDALVVVDVMESELTELATHVLPATGQLERADLSLAEHVALRSGIQSTRAVVAPHADRRPVWWMFGSLARRMGGDLLGGADPDAVDDETFLRGILAHTPLDPGEVFEAGPHGVDVPIEHGWVHTDLLPEGRWNIAPDLLLERLAAHVDPQPGLVLTPRREMAWSNSIRYAGSGTEPIVRMHPDDAQASNVRDGDRVTVTSAHGEIGATVVGDTNIRRGVVSFTHGRRQHVPGALTSSRVGVDPLTTMPHASGLPVTVTPSHISTNEGGSA